MARKLPPDSIRERIRSGQLVKTARLPICMIRVGVGRIGFRVVYMRNSLENFLEGFRVRACYSIYRTYIFYHKVSSYISLCDYLEWSMGKQKCTKQYQN